ncbi:MAG: hypothetical protein ACRBB3_00545 [Alphaproteobacteria bacterium]
MNLSKLIFTVLAVFSFIGATHAASPKEDSEGGSVEYVKLDPLILPVIDQDGVYQVLSLAVVIEVEGVSDADKVKAKKPRLKDAYIQDMYGILNENAALKGGVIQVNMIKNRLNSITDKVMGDKIDTEVLLQVVQQRPI